MEHYVGLFDASKQNDREKVLKNTYDLNELLHKMDIDERLRSQFVGTTLLYLKKLVEKFGAKKIDEELQREPLSQSDSIAKCSYSLALERDKNALINILNGREFHDMGE